MSDDRLDTPRGDSNSRRRWITVILAVAAVLVVGFLAWSMGEHAAGRDPLASFGGAQEMAAPSGDETASDAAGTSGDGVATESSDTSTITVTQVVDGASQQVTVGAGASVYDVLASSGVSFTASDGAFGVYVTAINDRAASSNAGWTYRVNDAEPTVGCSEYLVSAGDTIQWSFVSME